jgi:hypothetical protein
MKVHLTEFAGQRHFDATLPGTTIKDRSAEQFESELNERVRFYPCQDTDLKWVPGYADFCKLVFLKNWTNAKVGTLRITAENEQFLRTGYRSRRIQEVPVLNRWFEGVDPPRAEYLCVVLYDKEQLAKEHVQIPDDCQYGVVAILGQSQAKEEPMQPITVMRNALGLTGGGSGVSFDRKAYQESIDFWEDHATLADFCEGGAQKR